MSLYLLCFVIFSGCIFIYRVSNAQMILQSCIKDISVLNLGGAAYPSGNNEFYVTIAVDSETPINTTLTTLTTGSAAMSDEICFDFDTSTTTTIVSFLPIRGRLIIFNILGDGDAFGRAKSLFPNPSSGSNKTAFITDTLSIQPTSTFDGTITFSLYHQMKTSSIYLKIANRNFNVYRQCFAMKRLCLYRGGVENPIYPNDCINSTILQAANIQIYPDDGGGIANLLDTDDGTLWTSTPTPTATLPKGDNTDSRKCWAPFSQYIIIDLSDISSAVPAISSISLGFTADPSLEHSGDTTGSPPRWLTFAFDNNLIDLTSSTSDIDTDQFWAVDLRGGDFLSEGASGIYQYVWTVNPLFFQLDSKPAPNKFRMTQITKGFGLQYLESTQLQYRTPNPFTGTTWNTYAAAYILADNVNTGNGGPYTNQVDELAEVACKDIFPSPSPTHISIAYQSNTYNACWDYSPDRTHECYDHSENDPLNPDGELFYPPAAYILNSPLSGLTEKTSPYCVDEPHTDPLSAVTDWGLCPAVENGEMSLCMLVPDPCNRDTFSFTAIPMGWVCAVPTTPEPTTIPTYNPTFHPTFHPTFIPTFYPTNNPTFYPTINPTNVPTYNPTTPSSPPTFIPTINPSQYPTNNPTNEPTIGQPSFIQTKSPTLQPTKAPNKEGEIENLTTTQDADSTNDGGLKASVGVDSNTINIYGLVCLITALSMLCIGNIGYIDSRFFRPNDFFTISSVFVAMFQIFDVLSDIFLSVVINQKMNDKKDVFLVLFIFALFFIILPIIISFLQLLNHINKYWRHRDNIKLWITNNSKLLYLLSIFSGSSFTAIQLMNSSLFQLNAFCMDLTNEQLLRFGSHRIYSIVLFENLPQVVLQIIYLFAIEDFDLIAITSMIFSIVSIIVTVRSMMNEKTILNNQEYAIIEFNVTGSPIICKLQECRNQTKQIRNQLAGVLGVNHRLFEIMRPVHIPNGLKIKTNIHLNHILSRNINYKKLLNECQQNGQLAQILENSWNLNGVPFVSEIEFNVKESQNRIKNRVTITIQSDKTVKNEMNEMALSVEGGGGNNVNIELEPMPSAIITAGGHGEIEENEYSNSTESEQYVATSGKNTMGHCDDNDIIAAVNETADNMDIIDAINKTADNEDDDDLIQQVNKTTL